MTDVRELARLVEETDAFLAGEAEAGGEPGAEATYHLRDGGLAVVLRHGTEDVNTLNEIFHERLDAPPDEAREAIERRGAHPRVLDLGAHVGLASTFFLTVWPGARVTAVEPDRSNFALLERTASLNAEAGEWEVVHAAAAAEDGELEIEEGRYAGSSTAEAGDGDGDTTTVRAIDALPLVGECDLLKLDLEGGEWPVLLDPRFRERSGPAAVVLEYHPAGAPSDDARGAAERSLREAGFAVRFLFEKDDGVGMLWGWR